MEEKGAIKTVDESVTTMTQLVMPNDTNHLGNLMGGNLMKWMDIVCAMCAMRHAQIPVVTASVDNISFRGPINLGEICILTAQVTRVFNTSLEVYVRVHAENTLSGNRRKCNEAYFTFVAIDKETNKPQPVPPIRMTNENQEELYNGALRRRELRLILAGRMKPQDAKDLKRLFS